jgi:hypothetical protein
MAQSAITAPPTNVQRIRAEYFEMPGLSLTLAQASRLWGIEPAALEPLLWALVESGFLWRTETGCYLRSDIVSLRSADVMRPIGHRAWRRR